MRGTLLDNVKKSFITLIACFGLGLGMACMYISGLGADPVSLLIDGMHKVFGITEGTASIALNGVLFLLMLLWGRRFIYAATVITTFMIGIGCDFFLWVLRMALPADPSLWLRIVLVGASVLLIGFFIGFYITLDFGSAPVDASMQMISDRTHKPYKYSMWITYSTSFVLGLVLGGTWGIGTVLHLLLTGTITDYSSRFFRKKWPIWLKISQNGTAMAD